MKRLLAASMLAAVLLWPFHVKHLTRVGNHKPVCLDLGFYEDGTPISVCR